MGLTFLKNRPTYLLISTAILLLSTSLSFSNICKATQVYSEEEYEFVLALEKAANVQVPQLEIKNEIVIEIIQPTYGDYSSDYKKEIIRQGIRAKEGNNPLRMWYFTMLKLNDRFKERQANKLIEAYRYDFGEYRDPDRIESLYLLNNRVVHLHFPFIDIKDTLIHINVYDKNIVEKYFTIKQKDTGIVTSLGVPYYIATVKLDFGFVDELAANIATAKIGKQGGLRYEIYKKRAELRLKYLKEVYNHIKKKNPADSICMGQLIALLEKELMRL